MKRKLAAAVVAVLAVGLSATATAQPAGPPMQVEIEPNAQYDVLGNMIHVELKARCDPHPAPATVIVVVTQALPESPTPAAGNGSADVLCDGQTHEVAVTVFGTGFDAGKALAEAELAAPSGFARDKRQIDIRVV